MAAFMYSFIFHARNSTSLQLLQSIRGGFLFAFEIIYSKWMHTICVLFKVRCSRVCFQKQNCDCSFVAHSCPTLGISRYSPGSKGFSEALLIGCNLLFKLERQQASSLTVYKQLMQGTPILLVTTGVYLFPLPSVSSYLISRLSHRRIDSSCIADPGVNSYSVVEPSGEEALRGDLVWILKCP